MAELDTLYQLQKIDHEIDEATRRLESARASLGITEALRDAQKRQVAATTRLQELETRLRALEWDADDRSARIKELDTKLYSGTIKNPKEMSGLQTEIEHLKSALSEVEEKALETMTAVDEARAAVERSRSALAEAEAQWKTDQESLRAEAAAMDNAVATLRPRRETVVAGVTAPVLARYEELRRSRNGLAVAQIDRNTCLGCRTTLPTSQVQGARQGKIVYCSSCGRILHGGR